MKKLENQASNTDLRSALMERNDNLINLAEITVKEKLPQIMSCMEMCSCKKCINDVLAIALNSIPSKYVTTDSGKQYLQLNLYLNQYETDIVAALTKACARVKTMPRHKDNV